MEIPESNIRILYRYIISHFEIPVKDINVLESSELLIIIILKGPTII